ncbi:fatty acid desaturase [Rhodobacter sp. KR11]|uniref:fatty acid desaturase n=1 Tax=Rhodobacter sp. KR11 TaxID=2974588 RepID=UPI0022234B5A|nr:fatty acid desaturase [Rhodobacter sp. KR11]MCW1920165.1 fatty acid desaturase [Rhodobacter sp. KR11]
MSQTPDHRLVVSRLDPALRADLSRVSNGPGLRHLALYLAAMAVAAGLAAVSPLGLVPLGLLLTFLFTLEHECTHRTPFRGALNDGVGRVCGLVLVLPFEWFRWFHMAHHRHTNQPGDPELASPKPRTRGQWALHVSGLPYWWAAIRLLGRLALGGGDAFLPASARPRAVTEARGMLAIYALGFALAPGLVLWFWVLPMVLTQPFLRLYLLAEHGDCPQVADMLENTRTTLTNRLVRFLAWNMPYHIEHHSLPQVPFHQLPRLHQAMRADLKTTAAGYVAFARDQLRRL